jgi:solute:Na+ symporter, SSS family
LLRLFTVSGMKEIHEYFGWIDWFVVFGYMALTTLIGHALRGEQATIKDFFLGGKSLPWPAVTGSIIATEISALTFIGVPGMVFALDGDFTYLVWGIGSIIARFLVGFYLVPLYYQREIYSPYDYMGNQLGERVKKLVTILFSLGSILGQSVRVLVTAIILKVVTGMPMEVCIVVIGVFAVIWTLMGGMRTVIWTDVIQFFIFILGGMIALIWLINAVGWDQFVSINSNVINSKGEAFSKFNWLDMTSPFEGPMLEYTFWVAVIAMPFQNMAAFGTDQLNAQRIFCCGSEADARKAIIWSSVSQLITLLMLMVGTGLFAWYVVHEPTAQEAALFAKDSNNVFPTWIVTVLPTGMKGLIIAGAFAAAVSSLDSILAALSQTSLSAYYGKKHLDEHGHDNSMVKKSRMLVIGWALILSIVAILLSFNYNEGGDKDLIGLAFRMVAYVYGALLGILILAIGPWKSQASYRGILTGVIFSILVAAWALPDVYNLIKALGISQNPEEILCKPDITFAWFYPINTIVTVFFGLIIPGSNTEDGKDHS